MRRVLLTLALVLCSIALAGPALANPHSRIIITTDRPAVVGLDGEYLEYTEGTTNVEKWNLAPGRHILEVKNLVGKTLHESEVHVPGGGPVEIRARWKDKQFELIDTVFVEAPPAPPEVIVVEREPVHSEGVSVSISGGGTHAGVSIHTSGDGVHESVTIHDGHHDGAVVVVTEEHHDHEVVPASRNVTFRVTDDSWSNVYIDGRKVWEPRAMAGEKTVSVTTGEHTLEVKDFMENDTWCKGTLIVDGHTDLVIGIAEESTIEVYNDSDAFIGR